MRKFIMLSLLVLVACSREEPATDVAAVPASDTGHWRVLIGLPEVELPVGLHLAADGSKGWFSNGIEKVSIPEISRQEDGWLLRFPTFNNTIRLKATESGFEGSLTVVRRGYEQHMPLVAEPDPGYRFSQNPIPGIDVTGRWEVMFTDDEGKESIAVGEFDQQGAVVTGTFLTPLGDYRYLAGEVDGDHLYLSTFDGAHAFVFTATGLEDGSLKGDFWSGTKWHESWVAKRNFDARLPDAYGLTFLKEGYDRLEFSFPDLDGVEVSLSDEIYRDKVVLVNLSGTWCPNCADEMEYLSSVYRDNRDRGLEVISLLYEHFEEFELAAQQGRELVEKHDIDFRVLVAGSSDKAKASETLPMLNRVLAFPTLIFIDRAGEVRNIHTGFSGPGTGQHYEDFKLRFTENLELLLNDQANGE